MIAQTLTSTRSRTAYLRRLAIVFADELRLKIVTELYLRPMSPTRFFEEFGGGNISRVDRHFKKLLEHGWLRHHRTEHGSRPGGPEHFYRATKLAIFDRETWRLLPYSIKVAFSWRSFNQLAERVRDAMEAGTFDARADRHLSWSPVVLDQLGWERVTAAVDALFEFIFEEQDDAKLRVYRSGEKPFLATVALVAFESPMRSPQPDAQPSIPILVEPQAESAIPLNRRLSKVFADPLCLKIVAETNLREMSAPQFHAEFGGAEVDVLRRRFKMLAEIGWLIRVNKKSREKRRGAREHFYRATGPAVFDNDIWANVPDSIKAVHSWTTFKQLSGQVGEAMEEGTFDAREDRHLSWSLLRLDQFGWERVIAAVDALFVTVFSEQEGAQARIEEGEEPLTMTVALAAFESPRDAVRAP